MIEPTVGRILHYYRNNNAGAQPLPAIVTQVHNEKCVDLCVFTTGEVAVFRGGCSSVQLLQDGDERPETGSFCEWMPYQKGQAAKTEELEGQLSGKGSATKNDNPSAKTGKTDKPDSGVQGGQQAPGTDPKK